MSLGSSGGVGVAPPPPPPLSSSGGGSGPSSLSPGTVGGYTGPAMQSPLQPPGEYFSDTGGIVPCHGPGPTPGLTAPCAGGASVPAPAAPHQLPGQPDFRYSGTELVMLYDYKVGVIIVKTFAKFR